MPNDPVRYLAASQPTLAWCTRGAWKSLLMNSSVCLATCGASSAGVEP
jgi:hypothetical protein